MVPNNADYEMEEILKSFPELLSGKITYDELNQLHDQCIAHENYREYDQDCKDKQVGGDHYKNFAIQPIDIIVQNKLSFLEGCILKRLHRWRTKGNPVEDLKKMKHEIDLLIKLEAMPEEGGGCIG